MKRLMLCPLFIMLLSITSCSNTPTDTTNVKRLVALGQLWGFLKYHHPAIATGNYDWDMELIKRIPKIQNARNDEEWKAILDAWIDTLPPVAPSAGKRMPNLETKSTPDYGELFNEDYFLPQTIAKVKYILANASITSNHYISISEGLINLNNELPYKEPLYPDTPHRLLALFRHWNIINYFFPYRNLCDQQWNSVLQEMIPEFIHAKDTTAYYKACEKLEAKIDDSHGFCENKNDAFIQSVNTLHPPFWVRFIEGKLVITEYIIKDECIKQNLQIGDIITSINNKPVDSLIKERLPYVSASNYTTKLRNIAWSTTANGILRTNTDSMKLSVRRDTGCIYTKIHCQPFNHLSNLYQTIRKKVEGYQIIKNNIGYVYPASCTEEARNEGIKKVLTGTEGLIIDFRCYPSDYISLAFLEHLTRKPYPFSLVTFMNVSFPGYAFIINNAKVMPGTIIRKKGDYDKKIVIIVNEVTQSQAEDIVLGFQLANNVTVIGSPTAGANGAVTRFSLPGGIMTYMSGRGVYYPDGSNLQRTGVKIDEVVLPTIQGIRENRDEQLERAIEIIWLMRNSPWMSQ